MNFNICDFNGTKKSHMCWSEITVENSKIVSSNRIFDDTYHQIGNNYVAAGGFTKPNEHEFHTIRNGKSFVQLIYNATSYDLSAIDGEVDGWAQNCCFQEVDTLTGDELFRWCALEGLGTGDAKVYLNISSNTDRLTSPVAGNGSWTKPWDFCHMNSVDLTSDNNYLLSVRHFDQVVLIAGLDNTYGLEPGEVIWRLGGTSSSFTVDDDLHWVRQHHASMVRNGPEESDVLFFDNAWASGKIKSEKMSQAKMVRINNRTMEAKLLHRYPHPGNSYALAEGGAEAMPANGNVVVNYGTLADFAEFTEDGELLMMASLGPVVPHSYRAFKHDYKATPTWLPKMVAYRQNCVAGSDAPPIHIYASWNGATEVRGWRFAVSVSGQDDDWRYIADQARQGFETHHVIHSDEFFPWVRVQALDADDNVLSTIYGKVWVPSPKKAKDCNLSGCFAPKNFAYADSENAAHSCSAIPANDNSGNGLTWATVLLAFFAFFLVIQATSFVWKRTMGSGAGRNAFAGFASNAQSKISYKPVPQDEEVPATQ